MSSMDEIYREYSKTIYRYLLSLTHSTDLSEELTQETFYQAVRSIDRYDGSCKITTWLCAIAKNALVSYRRKHPQTAGIVEISEVEASAEASTLSADGQVALLRKLQDLTGEVREVMYLRLLGDLSFREIGDILSRTENWARVTYYRGREKLKKELLSDE
jgi:RNA polymerase sigma factor (sigma-70 family)